MLLLCSPSPPSPTPAAIPRPDADHGHSHPEHVTLSHTSPQVALRPDADPGQVLHADLEGPEDSAGEAAQLLLVGSYRKLWEAARAHA
eukprot:363538-Chlamydomonas_euryale.AAC.6